MKLLESRLAVATPLIPAIYFFITMAPLLVFSLLVAAAILRAQYEFYRIYYQENPSPPNLPLKVRNRESISIFFGLACGLLLLSSFYLHDLIRSGPVFVLIIFTILLFHLFYFREISLSLADSGAMAIGIFYVAGLLGYLILIRQLPDGGNYILFLLIVVWGNDAGAYYTGRKMGGKKLYPAISPNKTVSGSIGGFVVGVLLALAVQFSFLPMLPIWDVILLSIVLVAAGQVGDLVESMFKRSGGVKDSSGFIPAHGGLLDKLDGVAFAAPLLYYYIIWFAPL